MNKMWAPWRMKYILSVDKTEGCIFCDKPREHKDADNFILLRGEYAYVIMNIFPYTMVT